MFKNKKLMVVGVSIIAILTGSAWAATWERTYPDLPFVGVSSICETYDNGFAFVGLGKDKDMWLTKVDSLGNLLWTQKIASGPWQDDPYRIKEAPDKGLIVVGIDNYPMRALVVQTDSLGNVIRDTSWIPEGYENAGFFDITHGSDNSWIAIGYVVISPNAWLYITKLNEKLQIKWEKFYDAITGDKICRDEENYLILGKVLSTNNNLALTKIDNNGDTLWSRKYLEDGFKNFFFCNIAATDNGYLLTGSYWPTINLQIPLFLETDKEGDTLWSKRIEPDSGRGYGEVCWSTKDGYIMVANWPVSFPCQTHGAWLVSTDKQADTLWTKKFAVPGNIANEVRDAHPTRDNGCIILATTGEDWGINYYLYLIKTDSQGNVGIEENEPVNNRLSLIKVFPNPSRGLIVFEGEGERETEITVFDILGRKVMTGKTKNGSLKLELQPGIYFWRTDKNQGGKIIVIRDNSRTDSR